MLLHNYLLALEDTGLIRLLQNEPELAYIFRHILIQEAAYASLLISDRQTIHRQIAETLERLYPTQLTSLELTPLLGHHFAAAGQSEAARSYYCLAGDAARSVYAHSEAESYYRAALDLTQFEVDRTKLMVQIGEALFEQNRFEEAIHTWQVVISVLRPHLDLNQIAYLYAHMSSAAWGLGDTARQLTYCQDGLAALGELPLTPEAASLLRATASAYYFNGQLAEAETYCQQALVMAAQLQIPDVQAAVLGMYAIILWGQDQSDQALGIFKQTISLAETTGDWKILATTHQNLGSFYCDVQGKLADGLFHFQKAAQLNKRRSNVADELYAQLGVIGVLLVQGEFAQAEEGLQVARQLLSHLADPVKYALRLCELEARLLLYRGEARAARIMLDNCWVQARQIDDLQEMAIMRVVLIEALMELGEWEEIWRRFGAPDMKMGIWEEYALIRLRLGEVLARAGQIDAARSLLKEDQTETQLQINSADEEVRAQAKAHLALAEQRWAEAIDWFAALAGYQGRVGKRWYRAQTLRQWAEVYERRQEAGDVERAKALLAEALALLEVMQVPYYEALVRRQLDEKLVLPSTTIE